MWKQMHSVNEFLQLEDSLNKISWYLGKFCNKNPDACAELCLIHPKTNFSFKVFISHNTENWYQSEK